MMPRVIHSNALAFQFNPAWKEVSLIMARKISLWTGVLLLALGVLGLIFMRSSGNLLGIFPINLWLEFAYIAAGLWLWFASKDDELTRRTSGVVGPVFGILGIVGFIAPNFNLFGLIPIHGINNVFFLFIGAVMFYEFLSVPNTPKTRVG
jgi:Domain of unknown function (DUF4383)